MLEAEHPEICKADDPHGEKQFTQDCVKLYNEMMKDRAQKVIIPQYERDAP